jgi:hypothetical protein
MLLFKALIALRSELVKVAGLPARDRTTLGYPGGSRDAGGAANIVAQKYLGGLSSRDKSPAEAVVRTQFLFVSDLVPFAFRVFHITTNGLFIPIEALMFP